ncbi:cytochrome P450 [Paenibacillus sp.]|uniref:cytochrome P450 n=1 Tax=Paenibacillus sp. TaxID=58172 RepID=UPI00281192C0|nr:cytochrome P450 [Paenibacillus sp.]
MLDTKKPERYANMIPMAELDTTEKRLSPFPVYNQLRRTTPVRYDGSRSCWDVFRYEDALRVLKDPAGFSSRRGLAGDETETILTMDPPRHGPLRALVNKAFTPKVVSNLEPHIRSIADELLDAKRSGGAMDIVGDLTVPLPVIVIAELLGVPAKDRDLFKAWSDALVMGLDENTDEAFARVSAEKARTIAELQAYFAGILREHRERPQEDLISLLIAAEIDGQKLTDAEIVGFSMLLLAAGNETTTNLIANAVRILTEQPDLQPLLRRSPETIPSFVEETLRYYPPIQAIGRVCAQDAELGGERIRAGEQVVVWVASANRDESKFDDPDAFVPDRKPNQHLSFGSGIHFCLGAPLARLEAQIALRAVVERMEEIRRAADAPMNPIQSPFVFGVQSFPVTFRASGR